MASADAMHAEHVAVAPQSPQDPGHLVPVPDTDVEQQRRLQAILFKLNHDLDKIKDPVARFNEVQRRFWIQVNEFQTTLNNPVPPEKKSDNVLEFKKPE